MYDVELCVKFEIVLKLCFVVINDYLPSCPNIHRSYLYTCTYPSHRLMSGIGMVK